MPAVASFSPRCRVLSLHATTAGLAASFCISQLGLISRSRRTMLKGWNRQLPRNLLRLRFPRQASVFTFHNSTLTFICLHFLRAFSVHETGWRNALARREANRPASPKQRQQSAMGVLVGDRARRLPPLLEPFTWCGTALSIQPHLQLRFPTHSTEKSRMDGARNLSFDSPD